MFGRCPTVPVIVDVQFDAVAIGVLIVEGSLRAGIGTQHDAVLLQRQLHERAWAGEFAPAKPYDPRVLL